MRVLTWRSCSSPSERTVFMCGDLPPPRLPPSVSGVLGLPPPWDDVSPREVRIGERDSAGGLGSGGAGAGAGVAGCAAASTVAVGPSSWAIIRAGRVSCPGSSLLHGAQPALVRLSLSPESATTYSLLHAPCGISGAG